MIHLTYFREEMSHTLVVPNSSPQIIMATNSDAQVDEFHLICPRKRTFAIKLH